MPFPKPHMDREKSERWIRACIREGNIGYTRRVPVQRAVERDEIPYPYKVHDATLRPL